ncbi:MAG TPA: hypothetical protein VHG71_11480 [Verrucomicrobiae bacterium]|nr:hypothetical protein [Verrucomicrobiae bacterium]
MDTYTLMAVGFLTFAIVGISVIVWIFVRSRKREGIRPLQVTDKDRKQFREMRRELNIWRFSASFLGGLGALALVAGMMSFFGLDTSGSPDWRGGVDCFVFGGILILPAIFVARRDRLSK